MQPLTLERLKDLAVREYSRERPEIPGDIHQERARLAQLVLAAVTKATAAQPAASPPPPPPAPARKIMYPCAAPACGEDATLWNFVCPGHFDKLPAPLRAKLKKRKNGVPGRYSAEWLAAAEQARKAL